MLRMLAIVAAGLALQACTIVGSDKPLFSAADTVGAPALRPGLWAMPESDCKGFDPARPASQWPECANKIIVRPGTVGGDEKQDDGSIKKRELSYVLAGGNPRILQLAAPADRKADDPAFLYVGVRPLKTDNKGRLIESQIWLVLCEEPPDEDHPFAEHKSHPLPGMKVMPDDRGCLAEAQGPVREAAKASEGWLKKAGIDDAIITVRWVRDGEK
ncbi:MAG: hypothetical protein JWP35_2175 [Caulobacter sp.]|nr:hypothetical protein [Caulobacter sp.]